VYDKSNTVVAQGWYNVTSNKTPFTLASNLNPKTNYLVTVFKRTEAFVGVLSFYGFVLDTNAALGAPPTYSRKIEFIGDSITCGYGNLGQFPCAYSPYTEDNYYAWGAVSSRRLGAQYQLEAWSGKGVVRNYGDKNTTSTDPLPLYYPYTLGSRFASGLWDFGWVPSAVVINLGTNDYSTEPSPPENVFVTGYSNFIKLIRSKYAPAAPKIFLACGPLIRDPCCEYVQSVANITGSTFIDLQGILTFPDDYGCDYHPNVSGHAKMANISVPIISRVLGWN